MSLKVLIVLKEYYPKPAPTGVCVQNLQKGLSQLGIRSDVLQMGEAEGLVGENEHGEIYSINTLKLRYDTTKRNDFIFYMKKIPLIFKWPIYSFRSIHKYEEWIGKLNEKEHYDAIIGVVLPVETVIASSKYDNFIIYELDSIVNNPEYKRGVKKYYRNRLLRIEKRVYDRAKLIIHLENNRTYYSQNLNYAKYLDKTMYADVPNLVNQSDVVEKECVGQNIENENYPIIITYFGSLFPDYRSPEYIIKVLTEVNKSLPVECTFYSRGACEDIIERSEKEHPNVIKQGGYIEHDKVAKITGESDFLLSIGNKLTGNDYSLPSKVIEYIGSCKPIIHVSGGENDSAIKYLEKYELACILNPNDDFEDNIKGLSSFIASTKGKKHDYSKVNVLFEENNPIYTAKIIERYIKGVTK